MDFRALRIVAAWVCSNTLALAGCDRSGGVGGRRSVQWRPQHFRCLAVVLNLLDSDAFR